MGRLVDMPLPRLGETMEEGRIITWLKQPGESFRRGETLLEVETDKTVVECPALLDGKLIAHLAQPEDRVAVDAPIAMIEVAEDAMVAASMEPAASPVEKRAAGATPASPRQSASGKVRASGKARAAARHMGISLAHAKGTGRGGRITSADVETMASSSDAATIVLIHGLFADAASFSLLKLMLERSGYAVAAVDLPGHGASTAEAENLDQVVQAVKAELPTGNLVLVGHSLGAIVAARLAAELGHRVQRLLLLTPAGFGFDINGAFISAMLKAANEDQVLEALQMLGPARASRAFAAEQLSRIAARRGMLVKLIGEVTEGGLQKIAITADLARLSIPVTALFSRDDPIVPLHHALAAPRNVEVRLTSGTGHVPHWSQADFVVELLRT